MKDFPASYDAVINRLNSIDPILYGKTRNYTNGAISRLSPYISRGVVSTRFVYNYLVSRRGIPTSRMIKFLQELTWRDYFQRVWKEREDISKDIYQSQRSVDNHEMSAAIIEARTSIHALDKFINEFYATGYMHNHVRMYIASLSTNIARSHWLQPARWMYYYLLDADWGSNALSWQWVAGTFSHRKYYANQENINKYTGSTQTGTYLDHTYEKLIQQEIPGQLIETTRQDLSTTLPQYDGVSAIPGKPVLIYNFYNLDPLWWKDKEATRVLLFEPSFFKKYPVSKGTIDFVVRLSENIPGIQMFSGEFTELKEMFPNHEFIYKEHPESKHYSGKAENRDWLFPEVEGPVSSFSNYWKRCERFLKQGRDDTLMFNI